MKFALALHEEAGKYGVTVLDLPGCYSAGDSAEEAMAGAAEAIDGHVELLVEEGAGMPQVRPIDAHLHSPELEGGVLAVIEVPVERYLGPAEKINITVPALTLKRIDEYAIRHGESRSAFLVKAAEKVMRRTG